MFVSANHLFYLFLRVLNDSVKKLGCDMDMPYRTYSPKFLALRKLEDFPNKKLKPMSE